MSYGTSAMTPRNPGHRHERLGGKSNTGDGGEYDDASPDAQRRQARIPSSSCSAVSVVTSHYLVQRPHIQINMAQAPSQAKAASCGQ